MKLTVKYWYLIILVLTVSCSLSQKSKEPKRIFYVNSYHAGYGSSDDIMKGMSKVLGGENVEIKTFFMDSKRKSSETEMQESVKEALTGIKDFSPEVLIVSDDNAVKYLVQPYFNGNKIPVVFCGVNWSAEAYGLGENITGMLEVLPLGKLLSMVKKNYPDAKKLCVLSEESLSEQNNKTILDTLYQNLGLEVQYSLAEDFETWKRMFVDANNTVDIIYMPTNGAIKNWDNEEAKLWVNDHLKIPAVTCDDFMMPFCVFGLTKVASEQGEWAAKTALEILSGKKPSEIPYTKNSESKAWLNENLAKKIDFKIGEEIANQCEKLKQ